MSKVGLYIHIPFSIYKTNHRNVVSYYNRDFYINDYFRFLKKELMMRKDDDLTIDSIYIGGGDPSSLNSDYIVELLEYIREHYNVSKQCEITVEINPICPDYRLINYIRYGVNRFSINAFTFDRDGLNNLGILHDKNDIKTIVKLMRRYGVNNINLDMYFLYPGQNIEMLEFDIREVLKLDFPHVSYYSYRAEDDIDGTLIDEQDLINQDKLQSKMLETISKTLMRNEYKHYEINHFEKGNSRSHHNQKYWNLEDYIAVGIGAAGLIGNRFYKNVLEFEKYFKLLRNNELPVLRDEILDDEELEKNYIISKMGLDEGINISEINKRFDINFYEKYKKEINDNIEILELSKNNIRFKEEGKYQSNQFYMDII